MRDSSSGTRPAAYAEDVRWLAIVVIPACAFSVPAATPDAGANDGRDADASDAPLDVFVPFGPWGPATPVLVGPAAGPLDDDPSLTGDLLELYFNRCDPNCEIWRTTRASVGAAWATPAVIPELANIARDSTPKVTSDGLAIYFESDRTGTLGPTDIYVTTRASRALPFGPVTRISELASSNDDYAPYADVTQLRMVFCSNRAGPEDLYETTRATTLSTWSTPVVLATASTPQQDMSPHLSPDLLTLYLFSNRSGNNLDLYVATRPSVGTPFATPTPITDINTWFSEADPWISPDGRTLYFSSDRSGPYQIYESHR